MDPINQVLIPQEDIHLFANRWDIDPAVLNEVQRRVEILDLVRVDLARHAHRGLDLLGADVRQDGRSEGIKQGWDLQDRCRVQQAIENALNDD